LSAQKKKKSSKNNQNKNNQQSGFAWASSFKLKPFEAQATRELVMSALSSFQGRTGHALLDVGTSTDIPKFLWDAPLAILIVSETTGVTVSTTVNVPPVDDETLEDGIPQGKNDELLEATTPKKGDVVVVRYANKAALETVGLAPDEYERLLTGTDGTPPSSGSGNDNGKPAIMINLPTTMTGDKQFQKEYSKKIIKGVKDNKDDQDITIVDAQRWAIERSSFLGGKFVSTTMGVAYVWNEWRLGDSVVASPGGVRKEYVVQESPGSLREQIDAQGAAIRALKDGEQGQGLGNQDPQVKSAVAELLRLKALLEEQTA
jgi:hypothetical protein